MASYGAQVSRRNRIQAQTYSSFLGRRRWSLAVHAWNSPCDGPESQQGKDERTDYYKSTHAAAKYLRDLYTEFGDWLLVIAAYNGGPGNVYSAIRKSGSRNFWDLQYYLPAESRTHVKKFIGTHYVFEGQEALLPSPKKKPKNKWELPPLTC